MNKIAVLYYSKSGNTKKMAQLIQSGVQGDGMSADIFDIEKFSAEKALEYDSLIVGSPTYYGSMSYQVKRFFDDSVAFHGKLSGKVGAAFTSAANIGGGNETTINDILNAMLIHGMIVQGSYTGDHYGVVSIGAPDDRVEKQCRELGRRTAALVKKIRS
ncbi:MAG: flavodoxin family protein [Candidatus Omnitrophota bacterium]|nr:flavodoxin family protein [Candidatus Omnitrophota bacterium]